MVRRLASRSRRFVALAAAAALGAIVAGGASPAAYAQDAVLQASIDRPVVRDNESFTYTLHPSRGRLGAR
jgi:hypothetical protein